MNTAGLTPHEEQALDWCLRRQQPEWTATAAAELQAWLEASPLHMVAYLRIEQGCARVEQAATAIAAPGAGRGLPVARVPAVMPPTTRRWPWRSLAMAASVLIMLGGAAAMAALFWEPPGQYSTAVGSYRTVVLADGSRVELNTDTRIRASIDETARQVVLERGEAYFDIRSDAGRPFVVHADGRRIVVLGTRFAVRRDAQRLRVVVTQGKVGIDAAPTRADAEMPAMLIATRGDSVTVDERSALVTQLPAARLDSELAWRSGFLMFDDLPLAQAAAEFNRYNRRKLVIDDPAAMGIRISGSFEASNLDAFIRLLQHAYELNIDERSGRVRVSG